MSEAMKTFVCEHCGGEFLKITPDEDLYKEMMELFPGSSRSTEVRVLCDPCWRKFMRAVQG